MKIIVNNDGVKGFVIFIICIILLLMVLLGFVSYSVRSKIFDIRNPSFKSTIDPTLKWEELTLGQLPSMAFRVQYIHPAYAVYSMHVYYRKLKVEHRFLFHYHPRFPTTLLLK